MKVLLINGSPKKDGCTYTALCEVAGALEKNGIQTEIVHIGAQPISGCIACGRCRKNNKDCVIDDVVNEIAKKAMDFDGFVFGSPVYYAAASGSLTSFMDRFFYAHGKYLRGKPASAIVSCRRAGSSSSIDQINKYFSISQMPIVTSQYWNMVHGNTPDEVKKDLEGMQTMRVLGNNVAWLLKCIDAGSNAGIEMPEMESRIWTNYIR
ncbi:MAG: flavodoxin family protein [Firmicutes bacterium]|nr:flavodoxin family protein [Bacillota bacterium]